MTGALVCICDVEIKKSPSKYIGQFEVYKQKFNYTDTLG